MVKKLVSKILRKIILVEDNEKKSGKVVEGLNEGSQNEGLNKEIIPSSISKIPETKPVPKSDSEGIFWFEEPKIIIENERRTLKGLSSRERQQLIEINKTVSLFIFNC